jgi:hypothetical protein
LAWDIGFNIFSLGRLVSPFRWIAAFNLGYGNWIGFEDRRISRLVGSFWVFFAHDYNNFYFVVSCMGRFTDGIFVLK